MSGHGEFLIVTGMSGAGRSTVANALEDLGWYVVDNLPPQILRPMLELANLGGDALPKVAVVVDVRGRNLFDDFPEVARALRGHGSMKVLFLDAADDVLVRRYEAVRRPHPLQGDGTLLDGIRAERHRVAPIREASDLFIDTSDFNIHQLANKVSAMFADDDDARHRLTLLSFGFKYGAPTDADLVADMRFLPNPFWIDELRSFNGQDEQVRDYVLTREGSQEFLDNYVKALQPVFAGYQRENKSHSTIAIGCTGGKHRSVAMVEELARRLADVPGVAISIRHRDLGRE
ncbi:RNase adapter RapZ [Microbacterium sp. YY-01]|uniref:RNase adapter RapZ n=1 Tax=Microbacterium sp. YY-01 TaxID=3421634 RepID=UPI003D16C990